MGQTAMKLKEDVIVACTKCTSRIPIASTTYDKTGKNLICFDCYNKVSQGLEPEVYKTMQSADPNKINYRCFGCGFKFTRARSFSFGGNCFNCGRRTVEIEETKQHIIKSGKTLLDY